VPVAVAPRIAATFECVDSEAASLLSQAMGLTEPALVLQRFASGQRCYVVRAGGKLAAYGWVSFDEEEIGELGLHIHLAPDEAYIWDCATLPAYRGQHLYPALLVHIISKLRTEGLRQLWIGASRENVASQRGMMLAGFQPAVDVLIVQAPTGLQYLVSGRPGISEEVVVAARHALFGKGKPIEPIVDQA